MKENSEQLPDEQPERVYAELFEKLRESFFSIHKKCSISKQLQPHAKARDAAVTSYHMETLFPYDKKRSARMRTWRKNVPKHIFLPQIIEIILRQGTANGLWVLRKQYGQIAV